MCQWGLVQLYICPNDCTFGWLYTTGRWRGWRRGRRWRQLGQRVDTGTRTASARLQQWGKYHTQSLTNPPTLSASSISNSFSVAHFLNKTAPFGHKFKKNNIKNRFLWRIHLKTVLAIKSVIAINLLSDSVLLSHKIGIIEDKITILGVTIGYCLKSS